MKAKIVIAICVVAVAAYTAYNFFMRVAPSEDSTVKASFQSLSMGMASGNSQMAQTFISPTFSDKKISREDFLKVVGVKRKMYNAKITAITIQGDMASVSYSRTEVRGDDGEPITEKITGETWTRDKVKPGLWKLHKLADNDKWFRTAEIPRKQAPAVAAQKKEERVLGTLESGVAVAAMKKGERYNPAGKRDPFRPLIAIGAMEAESLTGDLCDPDRPREQLENFDLDALKLTGIIQSEKGPLALIETPDGKGYTVYPNMYLGKRCGKVVEMQVDSILLQEKVRKPGSMPGKFTTIDTPMQLRREEG